MTNRKTGEEIKTIDLAAYNQLKDAANSFYQKIKYLHCTALNEKVHFTAEGFNHLIYKRKGVERSKNDQIMKFKLLSSGKEIIEKTTTYQEYSEEFITVSKRRFKKRVNETVSVKYWGFVAILNRSRVKVIVRQIDRGQKHFWSVIPAWATSQYRDIKYSSVAKGNPKED